MMGTEDAPGLYVLAAQDIFAGVDSGAHGTASVWVSFFEIYCGALYDLQVCCDTVLHVPACDAGRAGGRGCMRARTGTAAFECGAWSNTACRT